MIDILGTDIKLTDDHDFEIVDGDIDLVTGLDCLKQDLLHALQTPTGCWGLKLNSGSELSKFVNGGNDPLYVAELRREIKGVFDREPRVVTDSLLLELYRRSAKIEAEMEFTPINQSTPASMEFIINNGRGS